MHQQGGHMERTAIAGREPAEGDHRAIGIGGRSCSGARPYDARMSPDGRRIGAHLPLGQGMVPAVERAHAIGLDTLQVFSDNPTAWRRRREPPKDLPRFRARIEELGLGPIAIHAAYLVNLAGSDQAFVERSIDVLATELRVAPAFAARYVNVHIGSHRGTDVATGTRRLADGVARVLAEADEGPEAATLVLENSAGGGDGLGVTLEEIAAIMDAIAARGVAPARVSVCLDTAHLWAAGYSISDPTEVDRLVTSFDRLIGLERLPMIHLNDSRSELGSRADRHQHIGAGSIGAAGMRAILTHPGLAGVTYYLETPGMDEGYDAVNAARVQDLLAGRPLPDLPAEAMNLPGSRSRTHPAVDEDLAAEPPPDGPRRSLANTRRQERTPAPPVGRRSRSPRPGCGGMDPGRKR
jgi:deoxyribonuclease-4